MEKNELREYVLKKLKHFPNREKESEEIVKKVLSLQEWKDAKTILAFSPLSTEPNILPLLSDERVLLPFINKEGEMEFGRGELEKNELGFWEPKNKVAISYETALMLVPLIAVDSSLNRLGHGKGFYDRYIKKNRDKLILFGVALSPSLVNYVPTTQLDQKLDGIISEK